MSLNDNPFVLADSPDCSSVDPLLLQRLDVGACGFFRRSGSPAAGHIWESLVDQQ